MHKSEVVASDEGILSNSLYKKVWPDTLDVFYNSIRKDYIRI